MAESENLHMSRIRAQFLTTSHDLIGIWAAVEVIAKESLEGSLRQETLDRFMADLKTYDLSQDKLKNAIQTLLVEVIKGDTEEIDVVQTKNGMEIS